MCRMAIKTNELIYCGSVIAFRVVDVAQNGMRCTGRTKVSGLIKSKLIADAMQQHAVQSFLQLIRLSENQKFEPQMPAKRDTLSRSDIVCCVVRDNS